MLNQYPLWKYLLLIGMTVLALIYALPNAFGEDPAVQISTKNNAEMPEAVLTQTKDVLAAQAITYISAGNFDEHDLIVRFTNTTDQLKARDAIKATLGDDYIVALNLAPRTPSWLTALGARPMKLGLDLRGGVNFLLKVDIDTVVKARQEGDATNMASELREKKIRYATTPRVFDGKVQIRFKTADDQSAALKQLSSAFPDYTFTAPTDDTQFTLVGVINPNALTNSTNYAVDQNMSTLNNRVNELGVSEAIVQRQGKDQISVDLPGIQDTARAKDLIGKTATLRFQLVDVDNNLQAAIAGVVPLGSRLYEYDGTPILLKNQAVLTGNSITYATATTAQDGRPAVSIRLGGGGEGIFSRVTAENIGKPLAVVYVETISDTQMIDGKPVTANKQVERIINVATIQSALGNNFEITGLSDSRYAQNLALLLRSGALSAPVSIIQERTVGPSLGAANIHKGVMSVLVGSLLVFLFMIAYYRMFGLVANTALLLNIIFIVAVLSLLGATLTLPGIAGIVLTVGMAVDANVLINERIREELRNGMSPQAAIHAGYDRAFSTIIDANVTTLLVAIILFSLGSGSVKGFAITLSIGIITSMITAIFFTRGIVNLIYGGRTVKHLSIGIRV
ncbi:MAG: secD [Gammaproteobacteria bacterium]|jgi:preprotein translocase subunit SecD|nr:secD [Gammaproteobacteria bacterium]